MPICDKELLVGYLYDDVEPAERRAMETHLLSCGECRTELKDLRSTRTRLTAWAPPAPALDFQMVRTVDAVAAPVRRWSIAPAWGLAAAAVLVLSVATAIANVEVKYGPDGLSLRTGAARVASATAAPLAAAATPTPSPASAENAELRRELTTISQRLRSLEAAGSAPVVLASARTPPAATPPAEVLRAVRQLISDSEDRQQRELALRISQVLRDVEGARRVDYDRTQRALAGVQGVADTTIIRQREMENLLRVVQTPR